LLTPKTIKVAKTSDKLTLQKLESPKVFSRDLGWWENAPSTPRKSWKSRLLHMY